MSDPVPETEPEQLFDAPWQARAFGLAVAFADEHDLDWEEFQSRLAEEIDDGSDAYYEQWLAATERLLVEKGSINPGEFEARIEEFSEGDRDASEFVEGWDGHSGHTDHEDHDHHHDDHSHDHDDH